MPLHSIPLCSVRYVGDNTLCGATFKYDTTLNIDLKNQARLIKRYDIVEIDKVDTKRVHDYDKVAHKSNYKLLYSYHPQINKHKIQSFYGQGINIVKEDNVSLENYNDVALDKTSLYVLGDQHVNALDKENSLQLINIRKNEVNIIKEYSLDILNKVKGMSICGSISLAICKSNKDNLSILHEYSLMDSLAPQIEHAKEYQMQIEYKDKGINLESCKELSISDHIKGIEINNTIGVDMEHRKEMSQSNIVKDIDRIVDQEINIRNEIQLSKDSLRSLYYKLGLKGTCKDSKIVTQYRFNFLDDISYKTISKELLPFGLEDNRYKLISKFDFFNLSPSKINEISSTMDAYYLDKDIKDIDMISFLNMDKVALKPINKNEISFMNKDRKTVFLGDIKAVDKDRKQIRTDDIHSLYKERIIFKPTYKPVYKKPIPIVNHRLGFLEVTKRWWVLDNTGPYDKKILPYDYDYSNKPLYINRRDRPFGNHLGPIEAHPITNYISKSSGGYDGNYGLNEFALSIEIMLDMTNIVAMILNHSASQFVNCSGQESMELIVELLYDWLNLESTKSLMNANGSRSHYLRCYRWIRWEAEKIWFTADKDHTQDRMRGLSYAGRLFENLADYLKYHHFNVVPLWRNIKFMDIERQYNRIAANNDLMTSLDKLKCDRHYFIETNKK